MRADVMSTINTLGDLPNGKDRLMSMGLHALYLGQKVCGREGFGGPELAERLTELGAELIRKHATDCQAGVIFGLFLCSHAPELEALIAPNLPKDELLGKLFLDMELARAVFCFLGDMDEPTTALDKIIDEVKGNVPLTVLEHVEADCSTAVQKMNAAIDTVTKGS